METIVTEILEIIKGAKDSISREEQIRSYFEKLACRAVSEALERIDKELAAQYADKGWHGRYKQVLHARPGQRSCDWGAGDKAPPHATCRPL